MDIPLDYIFIDTSVFQQEQFFKETSRVSKLLKLAEDGYICILLPIITEKEWLKHLKEQAGLNIRINEVKKKLALLGQNETASEFLNKYESLLDSYSSQEEIDLVFKEKIAHKGIIRIDYPFFEDATTGVFDKYFKQEKPEISELSLAPEGNTFRQCVWRFLCEIPYGETITYGELAKKVAKKLNKPSMSAQAVGNAVGHNPISIIIPCHRVVGKNGSLTGYAGGIDKKIKLLEIENVNMEKFFVPKI